MRCPAVGTSRASEVWQRGVPQWLTCNTVDSIGLGCLDSAANADAASRRAAAPALGSSTHEQPEYSAEPIFLFCSANLADRDFRSRSRRTVRGAGSSPPIPLIAVELGTNRGGRPRGG